MTIGVTEMLIIYLILAKYLAIPVILVLAAVIFYNRLNWIEDRLSKMEKKI